MSLGYDSLQMMSEVQRGLMSQSRWSLKWTFPRKWTIFSQSGRSLKSKWTVLVDGPGSKWTIICMKVDGPKESNWTVQKYQSGRSISMKVDGSKV